MKPADRILPPTRILAAVVVPFLALAVLILYFFPDQTGERFAWPVRPPLTAMLMASAYAGGVYFFSSVVLSRRWHTVKAGFPPVFLFASLLGIATVLHWDRFTPGHIAFILWIILYFTVPFLILAVWLYNRRQDPGKTQTGGPLLPGGWRAFFGLQALATLAPAVILFIIPSAVIPVWPWTLTPLTARVLAAMFTIPGALGLEIALDLRWSAAKRLLEAQTLSFVMILIAMLRSRADFTSAAIVYSAFILAVILILAALILLFFQMRARKPVTETAYS